MIWDGMAEMWQKVNREAKAARAARAVREAEDKKQTEFTVTMIVKVKKKK